MELDEFRVLQGQAHTDRRRRDGGGRRRRRVGEGVEGGGGEGVEGGGGRGEGRISYYRSAVIVLMCCFHQFNLLSLSYYYYYSPQSHGIAITSASMCRSA